MAQFITLRVDTIKIENPEGGYDTLQCGGAHTVTLPLGSNISHIQDLHNKDEASGPTRVSLVNGAEFVVSEEDVVKLQRALSSDTVNAQDEERSQGNTFVPRKGTNQGNTFVPRKGTKQGRTFRPRKGTLTAQVLEYFEENNTKGKYTLPGDLAVELGTIPATVSSLTRKLRERGYLKQDPNGYYYAPRYDAESPSPEKNTPEPAPQKESHVTPLNWSGRIFSSAHSLRDQIIVVAAAVSQATQSRKVVLSVDEINHLIGGGWKNHQVRATAHKIKYRGLFESVVSETRKGSMKLTLKVSPRIQKRKLSNDALAFGELLTS